MTAGAAAGRPASRADRLLLGALLLILGLAATLTPIRNPDYWWHLATGRLILQERAIPRSDPFSFTAPGAAWIDHEWLSQILLYLGHVALGPRLLVLVKCLLVLGLALLTARFLERERHGPAGASALLMLALTGASFRLDVRPELATLLILPIVVHLLVRARDAGGWWRLGAVVGLTVVGANLHPGAILVPAIVLLGLAATLVLRALGLEAAGSARFALRLAATAALSAIAIGVNPYGFRLYTVPFALRGLLASLPWPNLEWVRATPGALPLFFAALVLVVAVLALGWRGLDPLAAPALLLAAVLGWQQVRNVGLFFLLLPYGLARPARSIVDAIRGTRLYRLFTREEVVRPGYIVAAVLLVSGVPLLLFTPPPFVPGLGVASDNEPARAADFLLREGLGRRLYNDVRFGGYLVWRRYPGDRVFIDGRNEIYPDLLRDIARSLPAPDAWRAFLDRHAIDAAFLRYPPTLQKVIYTGLGGKRLTGERAFSAAYFPSDEWALVYWDDDAMIFARRIPANAALIARLEYKTVNPDDWHYLFGGVLTGRIPVGPVLAELERKLGEDPGCQRALVLYHQFAAFVEPSVSSGSGK